jgi:DNA (cytosine-5)-methyltransferase 1
MTLSHKHYFIDFFSGCGGLSLGFIRSGLKGIFAIEKDPWAFETLSYNLIQKGFFDWPNWLPNEPIDIYDFEKNYLDKAIKYRNIDILTGCPPCQGFSYIGKRNIDDIRNYLYKPLLNATLNIRPKIILFENVIGISKTFKNDSIIISNIFENELKNNNYTVFTDILDCSMFGVPQNRKRFFIWAINDNFIDNSNEINPFDLLYNNRIELLNQIGVTNLPITANDAIGDLLKINGTYEDLEFKNFHSGYYSKPISQYQKIMRKNFDEGKPDSHRFPNHHPYIEKRFEMILNKCKKGKSISKLDRKKLNLPNRAMGLLCPNKPAMTVTTLPDDILHYKEPRILTVRETARLQSFPDDFEFKGVYTTGGKERATQCPRYTQVANAVPPILAELMGKVNIAILNSFKTGEAI